MPGIAVVLAALFAGSWSPQDPEPTPAAPAAAPAAEPAIELLLAEPRALDAAKVRRRLARLLEVPVGEAAGRGASWLAADGTRLLGAHAGQGFVVRLAPAAPLATAALEPLDDDEQQRVSAHRGRLLVAATPPLLAEPVAVYRALGPVAAALLLPDVIAVGAAAHGTFVLVEAGDPTLRRGLLGEDPLAALAAEVGVGVRAYLRAARPLDTAAMRKALGREFGAEFADEVRGENYCEMFEGVVVVGVGGLVLVVTHEDADTPSDDVLLGIADLRVRHALSTHAGVLAIDTYGPPDAAAVRARQRAIARTLAALWGDDVLAVTWQGDEPVVAAAAETPALLRGEDPVAAVRGSEPVPVLEALDQAAMDRAIAAARADWPTAVAHHRAGGALSAKFPFPTTTGTVEHIWVEVKQLDGDHVVGTLANEPVAVAGKKFGSPVRCPVAELSDWLFLRDGKRVGGYTVDVLDRQQRARAGR